MESNGERKEDLIKYIVYILSIYLSVGAATVNSDLKGASKTNDELPLRMRSYSCWVISIKGQLTPKFNFNNLRTEYFIIIDKTRIKRTMTMGNFRAREDL